MSGFGIGQLVRVIDPRNLAYGLIAMVMTTKKGGRSQVRFADLPKGVAASDDPSGFVNVFDDDELTAIGIQMAVVYALVTITERTNGQEYKHHCLAHAEMGVGIEAVAQAIAQNWHPYGHGLRWSEALETRCEVEVSREYEEITITEYAVLSKVLEDKTPPF
jgi:hypothetical protein